MEVLLIVYAVSWLILFLIYISFELNEKSDKQTKATWNFKLFCMTVFTFLAPIVVLAIPCICVYDFCRKKKMKEEFEKRNKSAEKVMQQLKNDAKRRSRTAAKRYRIAFKELPFLPDERQVIYVENAYDEKVNCFIRDNYDLLVTEFKKKNLEFVYLPLYFNVELIEEIRYYAPYIPSGATLPSSYILDYMVRSENRIRITPSFLFYPKCKTGEWVFSALFMDDINEDVSDVVQKVDDVIDYLTIKDVLLGEKKVEFQIERPAEEDDGDTLFRYSDDENYINEPEPDYGTDEKKADDCDSRTSLLGNVENDATDIAHAGKQDGVDETIMLEMDIDTAEIYANIQTSVKLLRLRGIALAAIREFIDKQEPLSPLVITEDLRLFLPLYNNIEIELSAQKKALYFLFLNHPEGIVLQHLEEYHNELVNYYKQSNKGVLTPKMEESIKKLEAYGNNQLNVLIARIREAFCLKFDEHLARNYFISGEKGQPYRIPLDPGLIEWKE